MTHFEFHYHIVAFFNTRELRRLAIARSDASLAQRKPVAAPTPRYFDSGEERFLGVTLYGKAAPRKLNRHAAGQCKSGLGRLPMYDFSYEKRLQWECSNTQGILVNNVKSLEKNPNSYCPRDESKPNATAFIKADCKFHGEVNRKTGEVTPCTREEVPAACKHTYENLKAMKSAPAPITTHVVHAHCSGNHVDYCNDPTCARVATYEDGSPAYVVEHVVTEGTEVLDRLSDKSRDTMYPEPKHLALTARWKELQDAKERLVQHHYTWPENENDAPRLRTFTWRGGSGEVPSNEERRKTVNPCVANSEVLSPIGGDSVWAEMWKQGEGTAEYLARQGVSLTTNEVAGVPTVLDSTYATLGQSDVQEWCRLNALQVVLKDRPKVVRDARDGVQHAFENNCHPSEYVNRQPALTLNRDLGTNDSEYYVQAKRAAAIRGKVERSSPPKPEFEDVYPPKPEDKFFGAALQCVPVYGPTLEEEAWGGDKYVYTTWVPKAQWFADKVEATNLRVKASRKLTANNVTLDPLRSISDSLSGVTVDSKKRKFTQRKEGKGELSFTNTKGTLGKMQSTVRDLNLTTVSMADRMGAFCNVVNGVWQPFKEGWQTHATSITAVQWSGWDKWLRYEYGITERMTLGQAESTRTSTNLLGWAVSTYELNDLLKRDERVWVPTGEKKYVKNLYSPTVEFAAHGDSCVCRFCGLSFLDDGNDSARKAHERQQHATTCIYCVSAFGMNDTDSFPSKEDLNLHIKSQHPVEFVNRHRDTEGLVKLKHEQYGEVRYVRTLPSDSTKAWVCNDSVFLDVNVCELKSDGDSFKPPVMDTREPEEELDPVREEESERRGLKELHRLYEVYPELSRSEVMADFRRKRRVDNQPLLEEKFYRFLNVVEERKANSEDLMVGLIRNQSEDGLRWQLKAYGCLVAPLFLGIIGSPKRRSVPSPTEALTHCVRKAREAQLVMENPKTKDKAAATTDWATWVVKALVCRLIGGTWVEDGDDVLSAPPVSPTCFVAALSTQTAETYNVLEEEMAGDEVAESLYGVLGTTGEQPVAVVEENAETAEQ